MYINTSLSQGWTERQTDRQTDRQAGRQALSCLSGIHMSSHGQTDTLTS